MSMGQFKRNRQIHGQSQNNQYEINVMNNPITVKEIQLVILTFHKKD